MGMVFGVLFSWAPGQTQNDVKAAPKHTTPPPSPSATREVSLPDINSDEAASIESPAERLHQAEVELFYLKIERHRLQKALEQKQPLRPQKRRVAEFIRRPCT